MSYWNFRCTAHPNSFTMKYQGTKIFHLQTQIMNKVLKQSTWNQPQELSFPERYNTFLLLIPFDCSLWQTEKVIWIILMSSFLWHYQNLCWLSLAYVIDWKVVLESGTSVKVQIYCTNFVIFYPHKVMCLSWVFVKGTKVQTKI